MNSPLTQAQQYFLDSLRIKIDKQQQIFREPTITALLNIINYLTKQVNPSPTPDHVHNAIVAVKVILDQVDYTAGACRMNEMVGAVLPVGCIQTTKIILESLQAQMTDFCKCGHSYEYHLPERPALALGGCYADKLNCQCKEFTPALPLVPSPDMCACGHKRDSHSGRNGGCIDQSGTPCLCQHFTPETVQDPNP